MNVLAAQHAARQVEAFERFSREHVTVDYLAYCLLRKPLPGLPVVAGAKRVVQACLEAASDHRMLHAMHRLRSRVRTVKAAIRWHRAKKRALIDRICGDILAAQGPHQARQPKRSDQAKSPRRARHPPAADSNHRPHPANAVEPDPFHLFDSAQSTARTLYRLVLLHAAAGPPPHPHSTDGTSAVLSTQHNPYQAHSCNPPPHGTSPAEPPLRGGRLRGGVCSRTADPPAPPHGADGTRAVLGTYPFQARSCTPPPPHGTSPAEPVCCTADPSEQRRLLVACLGAFVAPALEQHRAAVLDGDTAGICRVLAGLARGALGFAAGLRLSRIPRYSLALRSLRLDDVVRLSDGMSGVHRHVAKGAASRCTSYHQWYSLCASAGCPPNERFPYPVPPADPTPLALQGFRKGSLCTAVSSVLRIRFAVTTRRKPRLATRRGNSASRHRERPSGSFGLAGGGSLPTAGRGGGGARKPPVFLLRGVARGRAEAAQTAAPAQGGKGGLAWADTPTGAVEGRAVRYARRRGGRNRRRPSSPNPDGVSSGSSGATLPMSPLAPAPRSAAAPPGLQAALSPENLALHHRLLETPPGPGARVAGTAKIPPAEQQVGSSQGGRSQAARWWASPVVESGRVQPHRMQPAAFFGCEGGSQPAVVAVSPEVQDSQSAPSAMPREGVPVWTEPTSGHEVTPSAVGAMPQEGGSAPGRGTSPRESGRVQPQRMQPAFFGCEGGNQSAVVAVSPEVQDSRSAPSAMRVHVRTPQTEPASNCKSSQPTVVAVVPAGGVQTTPTPGQCPQPKNMQSTPAAESRDAESHARKACDSPVLAAPAFGTLSAATQPSPSSQSSPQAQQGPGTPTTQPEQTAPSSHTQEGSPSGLSAQPALDSAPTAPSRSEAVMRQQRADSLPSPNVRAARKSVQLLPQQQRPGTPPQRLLDPRNDAGRRKPSPRLAGSVESKLARGGAHGSPAQAAGVAGCMPAIVLNTVLGQTKQLLAPAEASSAVDPAAELSEAPRTPLGELDSPVEHPPSEPDDSCPAASRRLGDDVRRLTLFSGSSGGATEAQAPQQQQQRLVPPVVAVSRYELSAGGVVGPAFGSDRAPYSPRAAVSRTVYKGPLTVHRHPRTGGHIVGPPRNPKPQRPRRGPATGTRFAEERAPVHRPLAVLRRLPANPGGGERAPASPPLSAEAVEPWDASGCIEAEVARILQPPPACSDPVLLENDVWALLSEIVLR
ncbi:hypothetical protein DIPPA_26495 [Diplonema papillatum]|nr:hypothetical protein DIPPA_26495 [Diplonema papillatum]